MTIGNHLRILALASMLAFSVASVPAVHIHAQPAGNGANRTAAYAVHTLHLSDNGSTLDVATGDAVELSLSSDLHWNVSATNPSTLVPLPGPFSPDVQGAWLAVAPGQAVITADGRPICNPGAICPDFGIQFQATINVVAATHGVYTLHLSDNGSTLDVATGDAVELSLSSDLHWNVSATNPSTLVPLPGPFSPDVQGAWLAVAPGQAVITADGRPICNPGAICPDFGIQFQATINVSAGSSIVRGIPAGN